MSKLASSPPRAVGRCTVALIACAAALLATACRPDATAPANPTVTAPKAATTSTAAAPPTPADKSASTPKSTDKKTAAPTAEQKAAAQAEKDKARQAAAEQVPVETAPVTRGPISAFLTFNTTLETEATVDIYPQTSGQVETLLVEEGRIVKAGDPLLKIEDRELRVDAAESANTFAHQQQGFARVEDLFKRNLLNKQEYDDSRFQLEQARLRDERARLRLAYATVRAPFDGVIATRETQVGARVGTGTKLFSMVKLDEIVARVFVPGRYLPVVAENQPAIVTSEFLPDRTFPGWVKRISPVIDPKSGTFKVTVGVRGEKPNELPPGLFVGVRVITDTRPAAVLVPKRAIVYEGGERYVFTIVKDRAVKRKLVVGYEDPQNLEARSGFEVGTPVIVLGQNGLKDGSLVRAVNVPVAPGVAPTPEGPAPSTAVPAAPVKTNR